MSFLYIYFGCLVCSVLFLKQRFPVAPIKSDLCFIEYTVVYMLDLVLPSTSVSLFSVTLGKHSTNTVWEARGNTFKAVLVSHFPLPTSVGVAWGGRAVFVQQRGARPWEFHLQQSSIDPIMKACVCLVSLSQMLPVGKYIKCFLLGAGAEVGPRVRRYE